MNGRVIEGVTSSGSIGAKSNGSAPKITGQLYQGLQTQDGWANGAFALAVPYYGKRGGYYDVSTDNNSSLVDFDASRSSSAYSRTDNQVRARSLSTFYIIKY